LTRLPFSLKSAGNTILLTALIVAAIVIEPALLNERAVRNVLTTATPLMMVAAAQAMVMLTGGVDLSVGSILSLSNVVAALSMQRFPELAMLISVGCVVLGAVVGLLNGALVAYARLNAFIITLAVGIAVQGLTLSLMSEPSGRVPPGFREIVRVSVGAVPAVTVAVGALFLLLSVFLRKTPRGLELFAIGGNEASARMSGVPTRNRTLSVYVFSGVLSACAGLFLAARVSSGDPLIGDPYTLDSVTAAVLGGTSVVGGTINLAGAFVASILLTLINTLLNFKGISPFFQWIIKGTMLIGALSLDLLRRRLWSP
jgi:ribose/xylose/arabinose/galactoside ABC-type transport system permease subunit